jgi:hypothetical protein
MDMNGVALPKRVGPKNGTFAFTQEGERQIHDAVVIHGIPKIRVAVAVDASLPTIDAIIKRVKRRTPGNETAGDATDETPSKSTRGEK